MRSKLNIFAAITLISTIIFFLSCSGNRKSNPIDNKTIVKKEFSTADYVGWKEVDKNDFQFKVPADMKEEKYYGVDNAAWKFSNKEITLIITLGVFITDLETTKRDLRKQADFSEEEFFINDRTGYFATWTSDAENNNKSSKNKRFYSEVYFDKFINENKLVFVIDGNSIETNNIAKKIAQSIKFKFPQSQDKE
jgi:hypothetical protein